MNTIEIRLPSQVTDQSLFKTDEASFEFEFDSSVSADDRKFRVASIASPISKTKFRLVGDGVYFTDATLTANYGQELTASSLWTDVYVSNGSGILFISGFRVGELEAIEFSLAAGKVKYNGGFLECFNGIRVKAANVDLTGYELSEVFPEDPSRIQVFEIPVSNVSGNFNDIPGSDSVTGIAVNNTSIDGDISQFAKFKNLGSLSAGNVPGAGFRNVKLSGSLESLFDALFANGRTSGVLTVNVTATDVTYNGEPEGSTVSVTFSDNGWSLVS